jgi:flagellar assembly factor FliW
MILVDTARFGQVEVDEQTIIRLPRGIIGFEDAHNFFLVQPANDAGFQWLQCMTRPELAFAVVDPSRFFSDYEPSLSSVEAEYLGITKTEDTAVFSLISIDAVTHEVTANLVGPIVLNVHSLVGMQVVLEDERYGTRHLVVGHSKPGAKDSPQRAA